jgi:hypothetical protein
MAYNFLNISDRAQIYSNLRLDSFDQLLNNLKASYFSTALMIDKQLLINDLTRFFNKKKFDNKFLLSLPDKYNVSPEMLFQRVTNILSKHFNISNFYFLRINSIRNSGYYTVTKEIRLNTKDNPGGYQTSEHYCRRWLSINLIKKLEELQKKSENFQSAIAGIQKSVFINSGNEYLSISISKHSTLLANSNYSVTLGFLMNDELRQRVAFANNPDIKQLTVNDTCERCQIMDCKERVEKPVVYESKLRMEKLQQELKDIVEKESS